MSLNPVDVAATVAAVSLAATRLLSTAQPLWAKLPRFLAVVCPVLVLSLPQIAQAAGLVHTDVDLANFAVMSVALLVPGIAEAEKQA